MEKLRVKLVKERQTKRKTVYTDNLDLFGTVYLDSAQLSQMNGGTVPDVLWVDVMGDE